MGGEGIGTHIRNFMRFLLSIDLKLPVVVCGGVGKVAEGVGWDVQMKEGIILCSIDYLLRSVFLCINHLPMFFHLPLSRKKMKDYEDWNKNREEGWVCATGSIVFCSCWVFHTCSTPHPHHRGLNAVCNSKWVGELLMLVNDWCSLQWGGEGGGQFLQGSC